MTKLLEDAFTAARRMPVDAQDDFARALLDLVEVLDLDDIEADHRAAVEEGMEQARQGRFASDGEIAEAFRRFGR